jgi:hypothetical protein
MGYVSLEKIIIKGNIGPLIISKTLRPHGFNERTGKNWWFYPAYYLIFFQKLRSMVTYCL